ncbi:N-6 DNA methylase [Arenibacter sp. ARW7G5Y1]|uniref:N-6 DNA methylase n=1 Tax=Arenibacter sp. ARW7G5Y1 TaxID=2135619 RepID=UPI000D77158A|nr:N-6 DNA methylase [Arenibacter sp. ARW7G5Y1]PXX30404.1 type I restriction enzyme M protein [Arenibacter sp. ARW7G5Y1]
MDFGHEENEDVKYISNKIWKCFNILRGAIPVDDFHVVLFLLSAYNDNIIDDFSTKKDHIIIRLKNSLKIEGYYARIFEIYEPIIQNINEENFEDFYYNLIQIDKKELEIKFELIFENLLYHLSESQGKRSGEFLLPIEITKLVMELAAVPEYARIYNPFAGLASFSANINSDQKYFAQELNKTTWALGMLRLLSNRDFRINSLRNVEYKLEDSIENWPSEIQYDLIVSNPPYGLKMKNTDYPSYGFRNISFEQFLLDRGLESIHNDGKVIAVLSEGILFRGGNEYELRKRLVEQEKIDTIISLPTGLLSHTAIPTCIVILSHNSQNHGKIRMVNAKDFIISKNVKGNKLDFERLLDILDDNLDSKFVRFVPNFKVRDFEYNLSVQRYFARDFSGLPLKAIITPIQGKRTEKGKLGKLVKIRNLKNESQDYFLNLNQIELQVLPGHSKRISESCVLISLRFKTLKATYFDFQGESIYITPDILAFNVDQNIVDQYYLINEMHAEIISEQVDLFRVSGVIPSLKRSDFLNIKVELPTIEEQRGKVKGLKELSKKLDNLEKERNALLHGKTVNQFDEFASLKHSIGAPRQNILSNAKSLLRFFDSNNSEAFEEVKKKFRNHYKVDLLKTFEEIRDDINHISAMLEKGEGGLVLTNYQSSIASLEQINSMIKNYPDTGLKFKIDYQPLTRMEISNKAISCNLTLMKILLDNIISNTEKYAFEEKRTGNVVSIEAKVFEDFLELTIKNNGLPFPKNFDKNKFVAKFSTANNKKGTGLGGYDINRIASHFGNPDWHLILDENDIYPVTFKFNFPIIPLLNE